MKQPSPAENVEPRKDDQKLKGDLMQEERPESNVPWSVYGAYIRASGSILKGPLILFLLILSQGANIATSLWLSYWTSDKFDLSTGQYIVINTSFVPFRHFLYSSFLPHYPLWALIPARLYFAKLFSVFCVPLYYSLILRP
ncbi:hypothetical protein GGI35DRAFT_461592 [Trichoderma velutinum]